MTVRTALALRVCALVVFPLLILGSAAAQNEVPELPVVVTHNNTKCAGDLKDGVLTIHLTFKSGNWHPDADDAPGIPILTVAEESGPPSIPGPMVRVLEGTRVHAYVHNPLTYPMFLHGFHQRPGEAKDVLTVPPDETKEVNFLAGAPGTYFYWATTLQDDPIDSRRPTDTALTGAFIVDGPGAATNDKVMVIGLWYNWFIPEDFDHGFHEILTINGKSFPHTEHLTYTVGDTAHWRVINASVAAHPMHMHGAFFNVDSAGDVEKENIYTPEQRRSVVTEVMLPGRTMAVDWTPLHAGNWIFHCHLVAHMKGELAMSAGEVMNVSHGEHMAHDMGMAGLVVGITVNPRATVVPASFTKPARTLTLVITQASGTSGNRQPIRLELHDGTNVSATAENSELGPPIVLHRDEPTEIRVVNRLAEPTAIHWHGIELESYYDGVPHYGGSLQQATPPIAPGETFVARMTPPRAGTFIYHTHWHDIAQLTGGLYGALIVLEPGQKYEPEHDRVYLVSRSGRRSVANSLLLNGMNKPPEQTMRAGEKYRLRFINITPNDGIEFDLRQAETAARWKWIAKDGADLPASQAKACEAKQRFGPGETYDYELEASATGDLNVAIGQVGSKPEVVMPIRVVSAPVVSRK